MENFFIQHKDFLFVGLAFLIGALLPNKKVNLFGKKIGEKLPKQFSKVVADKLDSLEQGLRGIEFEGDKNIVSNQQVTDEINKVRVDLGLDRK